MHQECDETAKHCPVYGAKELVVAVGLGVGGDGLQVDGELLAVLQLVGFSLLIHGLLMQDFIIPSTEHESHEIGKPNLLLGITGGWFIRSRHCRRPLHSLGLLR